MYNKTNLYSMLSYSSIFVMFLFTFINVTVAINTFQQEKEIVEIFTTEYVPVPLETDVMLMAKLINSEAVGETLSQKVAVGNVVLNRVARSILEGKNKTLEDVIHRKNAFTGTYTSRFKEKPNDECIAAAYLCYMTNQIPDSTYYYVNEKHSSKGWTNYLNRNFNKIKLGNHSFYH